MARIVRRDTRKVILNTIEIKRWDNGNVIFSYADICNTNTNTLKRALKQGTNLSYTDLSNYDLFNVDMSNTNLIGVKLIRSNLCYADLRGADLTDADLSYARIDSNTKISHEQFINAKGINDQCPKEGSFIGWKKCKTITNRPYIVKLEISSNAKRSSGTGRKCRCSHAKVLEIQNMDGTAANVDHVFSPTYKNNKICYRVNEIVYADSFDDRFWIECSNGIHFFINRDEAVKY